MRYAEVGINLEIDLSRGDISKEATNPKSTDLYLGGLGTNTKIQTRWTRIRSVSFGKERVTPIWSRRREDH